MWFSILVAAALRELSNNTGLVDQTIPPVYIDSWPFVCIYIFTVVMQIIVLMYSIQCLKANFTSAS